jgi:hypothetical protein
MTTYNPNTIVTNGGYQTSLGTVGSVTLTGAGGTVLSSNGAGSSWVNTSAITGTITAPGANFHNGQGMPVMTIPHGEDKVVLEERAELEVRGRIKLNGECLNERLERIETLLNIPTRDVTMEHKYPRLKEIWAEYNRELAKYKTWDALKDE